MQILLIALAGAVGTLCRYGAAQLARQFTTAWPLGTVVVNVLGCFVLALLSEIVLRGARVPDELRLAIGVGFCGGLTTYSTFNQDAIMLFRTSSSAAAFTYVGLTLVLCGVASVLGLALGRMLTPLAAT